MSCGEEIDICQSIQQYAIIFGWAREHEEEVQAMVNSRQIDRSEYVNIAAFCLGVRMAMIYVMSMFICKTKPAT